MALIGYARVSTEEQNLASQLDGLRAANCDHIFEEHASGADRRRPELAHALSIIQKGDTLLVARIDRLARSLVHLLQITEQLQAKGAYFRSLSDPIDTTGPSGLLVLQILGAIAEFERGLIRERTRAGIAAAKARGKVIGSPRLRCRDPAMLVKMEAGRAQARLKRLVLHAGEWLGTVRRLRPAQSWEKVTVAVNEALPAGRRPFTLERLVRAVKVLVREGLADAALLKAAPKIGGVRKPRARRAMEIAAAYASGRPGATLAEIGVELIRMNALPPRGGGRWAPSSVKALLDWAKEDIAPGCEHAAALEANTKSPGK